MHTVQSLAPFVRIKEYAAAHPRLRYLFLELTTQCNLRCRHCGSRCPTLKEAEYVKTETLLRVIDEICGFVPSEQFMFCITGGEPLLRPDWDRIGAYITAKGVAWGMTTNGTLIDEDVIRRMAESGMKTISVSLDGLKENHEWLRGVNGCFEKALSALRLLTESEKFLCVQATTVVNSRNIGDLESMYDLLCGIGIQSWKIVATEPIGDAVGQDELFLSPAQYRKMLDFILKKRASDGMEVTFGCSHFLPDEYETTVRDSRFHCGAGVFIASISAKGEILGCLDIDDRKITCQGSIYTDSFRDVWENRFAMFRQPRNLSGSICEACQYAGFCRGDSWHTWDFQKNAPRICLMNHLKKEI